MSYTFVPGEWNSCGAWVEINDDDGNVASVLRCSLECHADPLDGTAQHRDESGIWWSITRGDFDDF